MRRSRACCSGSLGQLPLSGWTRARVTSLPPSTGGPSGRLSRFSAVLGDDWSKRAPGALVSRLVDRENTIGRSRSAVEDLRAERPSSPRRGRLRGQLARRRDGVRPRRSRSADKGFEAFAAPDGELQVLQLEIARHLVEAFDEQSACTGPLQLRADHDAQQCPPVPLDRRASIDQQSHPHARLTSRQDAERVPVSCDALERHVKSGRHCHPICGSGEPNAAARVGPVACWNAEAATWEGSRGTAPTRTRPTTASASPCSRSSLSSRRTCGLR